MIYFLFDDKIKKFNVLFKMHEPKTRKYLINNLKKKLQLFIIILFFFFYYVKKIKFCHFFDIFFYFVNLRSVILLSIIIASSGFCSTHTIKK